MSIEESAARTQQANQTKAQRTKAIGKLVDLLADRGIDVDDIGRVEKIKLSSYQGLTKDEDGEAHVHDLESASVVLSPKWETGPEWPVVQPGPPVKIHPKPLKREKAKGWRTMVFLPDIQAGYFRDRSGTLHPTHDPAAVDVARQITRAAKPDLVVLAGDNADFPELSKKFRRSPAFADTTQETIDYCTEFAASLRADVGPDCEIKWLAGNHEERLPNYIIDNAAAAFALRQGKVPDSWPVLSMPHLCRFDDSGVDFLPGYPANKVWVNDRLVVKHGARARKNGSTVHQYLNEIRVSTLVGHVHRREWAERTRETKDGPRTILAASPGCLARIDGRVPSAGSGMDEDGVPIESVEDWQQGLAVVHYQPGEGQFVYEQIAIHDGWAMWRGREFSCSGS